MVVASSDVLGLEEREERGCCRGGVCVKRLQCGSVRTSWRRVESALANCFTVPGASGQRAVNWRSFVS